MRKWVMLKLLVGTLLVSPGCGDVMSPLERTPEDFCPSSAELEPSVLARTGPFPGLPRREPRWSKPPCLLGTPGHLPAAPQVAVAADGRALALWSESDGIEDLLWFSEYLPGTGWTVPGTLALTRTSPEDAFRAGRPQVAMDGEGRALVVWLQSEGSFIATPWFSRHVPGQGWEAPRQVLARPAGDASSSQLTMDAQGHGMLLWTQFDGDTSSENVWAVRYTPAEGWEAPTRIDTPSPGLSQEPQLSVSADGHAMAAWYRLDDLTSLYTVWVSRYAPGRGWSRAERPGGDDLDTFYAEPVVGPGGAGLVLWSQLAGDALELWARRFVPGTGWEQEARLEASLGTSGAAQAAQESGRVLVLWPRNEGGRTLLVSRFYDFESGLQTAMTTGLPDEGHAGDPQVALEPNGGAVVVWQQESEAGARIAASHLRAGGEWSPAVFLDLGPGTGQGTPRVAMSASGRAAATWVHTAGEPRVGLSLFK